MIEIINADVRDALKTLKQEIDDGSRMPYQVAITSPPYFRMRDYGLDPSPWGGDPGCDHDWGEEIPNDKGSGGRTEGQIANVGSFFDISCGRFCNKCGAWLGCLGMEPNPQLFVAHLVGVFSLLWDVLDDRGTFWLNLGDTYAGSGRGYSEKGWSYGAGQATNRGSLMLPPVGAEEFGLKPRDLIGVPWETALALRDAGWYLRSDTIWHKKNSAYESVKSRPTRAHEYIFLLTKRAEYFYNYYDARVMSNGAWVNRRNVWTTASGARKDSHRAAFPKELIVPMIRAGSSVVGRCPKCNKPFMKTRGSLWKSQCKCGEEPVPCWIIDVFAGSGTTGIVGEALNQNTTLIEKKAEYCQLIRERSGKVQAAADWDLPRL